jgi:hypothetical protein
MRRRPFLPNVVFALQAPEFTHSCRLDEFRDGGVALEASGGQERCPDLLGIELREVRREGFALLIHADLAVFPNPRETVAHLSCGPSVSTPVIVIGRSFAICRVSLRDFGDYREPLLCYLGLRQNQTSVPARNRESCHLIRAWDLDGE